MDLYLRYRLHPHDGIAIEILGKDVAACAEDDLAPGGSAQPPQEPAFDLRANQVRIDDDAAVQREHDALDVKALAVVLRDFNDLRAAAEVVGARDTARTALGQRRSPSGALRCELDGAQRTGLSTRRSRRNSTGSRPAAMASSSSADSRANSVCELPTERQTMIGTPASTFVASPLKFSNAYGWPTTPVTVMKSTPSLNKTSPTNGKFGEVGSAAICWWYAVRRPVASAAARTRCTAMARKRPLLNSSSSIGTTALTPGSASAAWSSTEATLPPKRGGWSTIAVSSPGRLTSIVNCVVPRIFPGVSSRSLRCGQ